MNKTIYVHIGFHKTATTFLQKNFFPKLKNIKYMNHKCNNLLLDLSYNPFFHKNNYKITFPDFSLISKESLSGDPFFNRKDRIKILKDIKSYFSDYEIKIIVCLREQSSFIKSLYVQYVQIGGTENFDNFLSNKKKLFPYKVKNPFLNIFEYDKYVKKLYELFGKENVYVYFYEDFISNKKKALKNICYFLREFKLPKYQDIKKNKSYGNFQVKISLFLNRFFKTKINKGGFIPTEFRIGTKYIRITPIILLQSRIFNLGARFDIPKNKKNIIKKKYLKSNERLRELILDKYEERKNE